MPKRTNHYQKLVKIITRHLEGESVKITESALLYDHEAETYREIDILIEATLSTFDLKIGIECKDESRPLDVAKVERYKEMHRRLGIAKTIIVAQKGFTKSAKLYAEKNNIKLLTFSSCRKERWSKTFEKLKNLSMYARTYTLAKVEIVYNAIDTNIVVNPTPPLHVFLENVWVPLGDFATTIFNNSGISKSAFRELRENELKAKLPFITATFNLGGKYEFKDAAGVISKPEQLEVTMNYKSNYRPLNTSEIEYEKHSLVAGGFFDNESGEHAHIVISEKSSTLVATMEFSGGLFPATVTSNY